MKRICLVLFFIASLIYTGMLNAEENVSRQTPGMSSRSGTTPLQFGNIPPYKLHYADKGYAIFLAANKVNHIIYHEPFLMFNAAPKPQIKDMPYIWDVVDDMENGNIIVTFKITLTSPELRTQIRDHVLRHLEEIKRYWGETSIDTNTIEIWREFTKQMTVFFLLNGKALAVGQIDRMETFADIDSKPTYFDLQVEFSPKNWEKFKKNKNRISVVPYYAVFRESVSTGTYKASAQISVVKTVLQRMVMERDGFLFLDEIKDVKSEMASKLYSTISADDPDLLIMLYRNFDSIYDRLLQERELKLTDLKNNPIYERRLAVHFNPLLEEVRYLCGQEKIDNTGETTENSNTNTDVHEDSTTTETSVEAGVSGGGMGGKVGRSKSSTSADIKSKQEFSDEIHQKLQSTGAHWTYDIKTQTYKMDRLKIIEVQTGTENIETEESNIIELRQKSDQCIYIGSSPIPLLVLKQVEVFGDYRPTSSRYESVGTLRLFIGKTIPPGWVELKKGEILPNNKELPDSLRGKMIAEDFSNVFIGVGNEEQRGQVQRAIVKDWKPIKQTSRPYYEGSGGKQAMWIYDLLYQFDPNQHRPDYLKVRLILKVCEDY